MGNHLSLADGEAETVGKAIERGQHWDEKAPCLKIFHAAQLDTFLGTSGKRVGYPIWELNKFTGLEVANLLRLDAIVVTSGWAKKILDDYYISEQVPVHVVGLGVDRGIFNEDVIPPDNDISRDTATKFYLGGKWELRKGFDIALAAFNKAFDATDNVAMIVNARNHFIGDKRNDDWAVYFKTSKLGEKIYILDRYLETQQQVANLMASCDAAVSLSRAEGWNLPVLEALSMGMRVITTNCTAHTEFCDSSNSFLINCPDMESAQDNIFFDGFGQWHHLGDDAIESAALWMRAIHNIKQKNGPLHKNLAGIETAKRFSWENCASKIAEACI